MPINERTDEGDGRGEEKALRFAQVLLNQNLEPVFEVEVSEEERIDLLNAFLSLGYLARQIPFKNRLEISRLKTFPPREPYSGY